jgi:hypothetical protein
LKDGWKGKRSQVGTEGQADGIEGIAHL